MWYIFVYAMLFYVYLSNICKVDGFYYINTILINFKCEFDKNAQLIVWLY